MSEHDNETGAQASSRKRLFAAGDLSDEETFREHEPPSQAASSHNFRPDAPTKLASLASDDPPDADKEATNTRLASAETDERSSVPPRPRTEMSSLHELDPPGGGFSPEAPTRVQNPVLIDDEEPDEIELSMSDFEALDAPEEDEDETASFEIPHRDPPPPSRPEGVPRILNATLPEPGAPKLPTGFIDRATGARSDERSTGRPVPAPDPAPGAESPGGASNPFRAAATMVDHRSLSEEEPALSELDVAVEDDSLLAEAPEATDAGTGPNPLVSDEDRVPTQNIRLELEAEVLAQRDEAARRQASQEGPSVRPPAPAPAPPPPAPQAAPPAPQPAAAPQPPPTPPAAAAPPPAPQQQPPLQAAPAPPPAPPFEAPAPAEASGEFDAAQSTQTEYVAEEESEVGPPELARWKVVPTGWGEAPEAPPEPRPPRALKTLMWSLDDEEQGEGEDTDPEQGEIEPKRWSAQAPERAATDGSTAIAARYLGDALNHLEEISALQSGLDPEARRQLHAKVFGAQQKLRRALDLLGAKAVTEED